MILSDEDDDQTVDNEQNIVPPSKIEKNLEETTSPLVGKTEVDVAHTCDVMYANTLARTPMWRNAPEQKTLKEVSFDREEDSDSEESDGEFSGIQELGEYLALMEDHHFVPFSSENHITTLRSGEILVGGKRTNGKASNRRPVHPIRAQRRGGGRDNRSHTISRTPGNVFPSELRVRLPYTANGIITNAGATNIGQRWHTNAVYDVDPIFGSTSTVGFYEISQLYHFYRVMGVRIWIEAVNNEAFPVIVYTIHSNNDLGTTGALAAAQSGNPLCRTCMLAPNGYGGAKQIVSSHTISAVVGSNAPVLEDNYRALINGIPADLTWFGIYATAGPVNVFSANKGISYALRVSMDTKFYGRTVLTQ